MALYVDFSNSHVQCCIIFHSLAKIAVHCMFNMLLCYLWQVCQLQGNGVGVSMARAQAERAADMAANEDGVYCVFCLFSLEQFLND